MKMVASVLHLDLRAIKALRITDPYSLHRVVYSLYPDLRSEEEKNGSQTSGILFADMGGDYRTRRILLLADRQPAHCVQEEYGHVESKVIPAEFLDHSAYRFQVIVNPTRRDSASKKLLPVKGREAVSQWFIERAETSWGFHVVPQNLQVNDIEVLKFKNKHGQQVTICQAHIQGQLMVTNRQQFQQSFTQGIGRARAFGCGLLQIVPVA